MKPMVLYNECALCCDKEIMTANDKKCRELRRSHLACFECFARDDRRKRGK